MSSFWSRILISAAGIPLVLWLMYLGGWPLFGLALVAALIALHELYWMTRTLRPGRARRVSRRDRHACSGPSSAARTGRWAACSRRSCSPSSSRAPPAASSVGVTVLGVGWIGLGLAYALLLRDIDEHGVLALYTVVLAVWAGDAAAYFVGLLLGRHKLAPTVSPGKTWEGLAAGTVATIAVTFIALYKQSFLSIPESLVLGAGDRDRGAARRPVRVGAQARRGREGFGPAARRARRRARPHRRPALRLGGGVLRGRRLRPAAKPPTILGVKRIAVLGATGSIGRQALDIIDANDELDVARSHPAPASSTGWPPNAASSMPRSAAISRSCWTSPSRTSS